MRHFVDAAARELDMEITWEGQGVDEKGIDKKTGQPIVAVDPRYFRPIEVQTLLGDATRARTELGWTPAISFGEMVKEMVRADF